MAVLTQALFAAGYYAALVAIFRLAGKRFAGQTTSFDLVVLISLAVVLQGVALRGGVLNATVFVGTVFSVHLGVGWLCRRSRRIRHLIRGAPRPLIVSGRLSREAMEEEGLSYEEVMAGLRKVGVSRVRDVKLATLEETGLISVIPHSRQERTQ